MKTSDFLQFSDVGFTYPALEGDVDENGVQIMPKPVFEHFSAEIPSDFITLIGPNASGKSTFMLLASGRILPQCGRVSIFGQDTSTLLPETRGDVASFIFQNMEFEDDDFVENMLNQVFENGLQNGLHSRDSGFLKEVVSAFELNNILSHRLTGISKGEIQRVLLAFSVLYGSKSVFMDEPMFAMEPRQKEASLEFLTAFSKSEHIPLVIAMHEIDLAKKYSPSVLLFYPNRNLAFGTPEEVLTDAELEKAYKVPVSYLKNYKKAF